MVTEKKLEGEEVKEKERVLVKEKEGGVKVIYQKKT